MAIEAKPAFGGARGIDSALGLMIPGKRTLDVLGMVMSEGFQPRYEKGYWFVEIPVETLWNTTEEKNQVTGLRNQLLEVHPACTVEVKGDRPILVEPNPELWKYGNVQSSYIVTPGQARAVPKFHLHLRKDIGLADIKYAIRIYKFN